MCTTTDLAKFGFSERKELVRLLNAWTEQGLPEGFYNQEVTAMMNTSSGNVFLTNEEFQLAMLNGNKLEIWHNCDNCGHEGFADDCQLCKDGCNNCVD